LSVDGKRQRGRDRGEGERVRIRSGLFNVRHEIEKEGKRRRREALASAYRKKNNIVLVND